MAFGAVIDFTGGRIGLHVHGFARSRFQLDTTAAPSIGVPSENLRFGWSVIVHVVPPDDGVADAARSGTTFPPAASWNSCPKIEFI